MNGSIKKSDIVRIAMRCIENSTCRYLKGLEDLNPGGIVSANPEINVSNRVLDYFSAHSSQMKSIILK